MNMRPFFGMIGLFCCMSVAANAQYTTKQADSSASGFTARKTAQPAAAQPAAGARPTAAVPAQPAAQPAAARPRPNVYRPRPKPLEDSGEEDLPSFGAFTSGSNDAGTQGSAAAQPETAVPGSAYQRRPVGAQGSAQGALQGSAQGDPDGAAQGSAQGSNLPKPKGEIWVYVTDFKVDKVGRFTYCTLKRVLQNRTDTEIERLSMEFSWPSYTTEKVFTNIKPKASEVTGLALYTDTCPALNSKPQVKVKSCRMGSIYGTECEKYIVVK